MICIELQTRRHGISRARECADPWVAPFTKKMLCVISNDEHNFENLPGGLVPSICTIFSFLLSPSIRPSFIAAFWPISDEAQAGFARNPEMKEEEWTIRERFVRRLRKGLESARKMTKGSWKSLVRSSRRPRFALRLSCIKIPTEKQKFGRFLTIAKSHRVPFFLYTLFLSNSKRKCKI